MSQTGYTIQTSEPTTDGRVQDWSSLLVDDNYFPYFLDYAMCGEQNGLGDIILFLLGSDRLRFHSPNVGCAEAIHIAEQYLHAHPNLAKLVPSCRLKELQVLSSYNVPLVAALAVPCDLLWKEFEKRLSSIYTDGAIAGTHLKKKITNDEELSLLSIMSSNKWKHYFELFIRDDQALCACYKCWGVAVTCIENIRYLRMESLILSPSPPVAGSSSEEVITSTPVKPTLKDSFMSVFFKNTPLQPQPRLSDSSPLPAPETPTDITPTKVTITPPQIAPTGASRRSSMDSTLHRWTAPAGGVALGNNTDYFASIGSCPDYDFTGPYEPFAFLLPAVREIQSYLGDLSLLSGKEQKHLLSDVTRLELQTVLTMTSSVRSARTVESVEIDYARSCALRIARLIHAIETEMFECLSEPFSSFLSSDHFVDLMGYIRCTESEKTTTFLNKLSFLKQVIVLFFQFTKMLILVMHRSTLSARYIGETAMMELTI